MFKRFLLAAVKKLDDGRKAWALVVGVAAFFLGLGVILHASPQAAHKKQGQPTAPFRTFARLGTPTAVKLTKPVTVERAAWTPQSQQRTDYGLEYETYIPRPTQKGYYLPKVVPYPAGKPVHVNGYYRKNGTYVQPHFRSLPRR